MKDEHIKQGELPDVANALTQELKVCSWCEEPLHVDSTVYNTVMRPDGTFMTWVTGSKTCTVASTLHVLGILEDPDVGLKMGIMIVENAFITLKEAKVKMAIREMIGDALGTSEGGDEHVH